MTLIERAEQARLTIIAFHCSLIGDGPDPSDEVKGVLEMISPDNTKILESLEASGMPHFKHFLAAVEDEDEDQALEEMVCALQMSGGFLIQGCIPMTERTSGAAVRIYGGITTRSLFWGATFDEALERATVWAEAKYGTWEKWW